MTTIQNGGQHPEKITWGGVQVPKDQIKNKGTIKTANGKTTYYIDFKSGEKVYYQESKGGKMDSADLNTHVSASFQGIKGLSIEGSNKKSDTIFIENCDLETIDVRGGNETKPVAGTTQSVTMGDRVLVHNSQNGRVLSDDKDRIYFENNTNVQSNRPTN